MGGGNKKKFVLVVLCRWKTVDSCSCSGRKVYYYINKCIVILY